MKKKYFFDIPIYRLSMNEYINECDKNIENLYNYFFVNKDGTKINGGFLGVPFLPGAYSMYSRAEMYKRGYIALKVRGKIYNYEFRKLNAESQKLALSLLGSYCHAGRRSPQKQPFVDRLVDRPRPPSIPYYHRHHEG